MNGFLSALGRGARGVARGVGSVVREAVTQPELEVDPTLINDDDDDKYFKNYGADDNKTDIDELINAPIKDDDPDKAEKQQIRDAYKELWKIHTQHAKAKGQPYLDELKQMRKDMRAKKAPKKASPLAAFAAALNSPEAFENIKRQNQAADDELTRREDFLMNARQKAMQGHIEELNASGKYKEALMQAMLAAELNTSQARIKAEREQKLEQQKGEARIRLEREKQANALNRLTMTLSNRNDLSVETMKAAMNTFSVLYNSKKDPVFGTSTVTDDDIPNMIDQAIATAKAMAGSVAPSATGAATSPAAPAAPGGGGETPLEKRVRENRQRNAAAQRDSTRTR